MVFPGEADGKPVELVFAVFLREHRPAIQAAMVDAATGDAAAWPPGPARPAAGPQRAGWLVRTPAPMLSAPTDPGLGIPAIPGARLRDLPFSREL